MKSEEPYIKLGKLIKECRKKAGITIETVAFVINVTREYCRRLEAGVIKEPGVSKIINIFYLLNLDINILNEIFNPKIEREKLSREEDHIEYTPAELRALLRNYFRSKETIRREHKAD